VGNASSVDVAEAGNQTMVGVGVAVSVRIGVAVANVEFSGRQAFRINVIARRSIATTTPPRLGAAGEQSPLKRESPVGRLFPFNRRLPRGAFSATRNDILRKSLITEI
jgi:hypothetical protein